MASIYVCRGGGGHYVWMGRGMYMWGRGAGVGMPPRCPGEERGGSL